MYTCTHMHTLMTRVLAKLIYYTCNLSSILIKLQVLQVKSEFEIPFWLEIATWFHVCILLLSDREVVCSGLVNNTLKSDSAFGSAIVLAIARTIFLTKYLFSSAILPKLNITCNGSLLAVQMDPLSIGHSIILLLLKVNG